MKKNYTSSLALFLLTVTWFSLLAQSTETFETEPAGATSFIDDGQLFLITSGAGESYNIFSNGYLDNGSTDTCSGCGWNGSGTDNKFLDNAGTNNKNGNNNGTNFTITTSGSAEIGVSSLYLFCSTSSIAAHSGTLTIEGKKSGISQFTITKSTGFANVTTFTPNNGFTFIDFQTEGGSDNSQTKIDELVISGSGNLDYIALDAFSWAPGSTLSSKEQVLNEKISIFPTVTSNSIQIKGIEQPTNYKIFNSIGKQVKFGTVNNEQEHINIENFSMGIYFITLNNSISRKFIKK